MRSARTQERRETQNFSHDEFKRRLQQSTVVKLRVDFDKLSSD